MDTLAWNIRFTEISIDSIFHISTPNINKIDTGAKTRRQTKEEMERNIPDYKSAMLCGTTRKHLFIIVIRLLDGEIRILLRDVDCWATLCRPEQNEMKKKPINLLKINKISTTTATTMMTTTTLTENEKAEFEWRYASGELFTFSSCITYFLICALCIYTNTYYTQHSIRK